MSGLLGRYGLLSYPYFQIFSSQQDNLLKNTSQQIILHMMKETQPNLKRSAFTTPQATDRFQRQKRASVHRAASTKS